MAQLLWYLRHEGKILGPYPSPQVQELLQTGVISMAWEASLNELDWLPLGDSHKFAEDKADWQGEQGAWLEERQRARQRWEGEAAGSVESHDPALDERRRQALGLDQKRTENLVRASLSRRPSFWIGGLALLALAAIGVSVWLGQSDQPIQPVLNQPVNCAAVAGEGVNWSGCDKRAAALAGAMLRNARLDRTRLDEARLAGAVLEYASATGASLHNADLRGAKLTAVDLSGADLSGSDLAGANLRYAALIGANLAGARLDQAVWSDGRTCATGSIGSCL